MSIRIVQLRAWRDVEPELQRIRDLLPDGHKFDSLLEQATTLHFVQEAIFDSRNYTAHFITVTSERVHSLMLSGVTRDAFAAIELATQRGGEEWWVLSQFEKSVERATGEKPLVGPHEPTG